MNIARFADLNLIRMVNARTVNIERVKGRRLTFPFYFYSLKMNKTAQTEPILYGLVINY